MRDRSRAVARTSRGACRRTRCSAGGGVSLGHLRYIAFYDKPLVKFEQSLELHEGLVVERDVAQVAERDAPFPETVAYRLGREPGIVLFAIESFFLRRRDDLAVAKQARRAIVVESRDA